MSDQLRSVTLTPEQLQELMSATVAAAVRAAREPDAATKAKLQKEADDAERKRQDMLELARVEEQSKQDRWASCSHTKENGRPCVGGQINSDGLVHNICLRCQYEFPPFAPTKDMVATGF